MSGGTRSGDPKREACNQRRRMIHKPFSGTRYETRVSEQSKQTSKQAIRKGQRRERSVGRGACMDTYVSTGVVYAGGPPQLVVKVELRVEVERWHVAQMALMLRPQVQTPR